MIDLKHLMLYDGKPWDFNRFNEPLVIDLQGLEYKQGGVPVIVKGKPNGYADITIAPIDKRDEIGLAIYADVHVEDGKLPENYTVGLDINIDDKYYMHPGTNLEINQDKWIVSSKGVWIAEPVTINAVYISEETTTTWLIDGWKNTITQPEQKTEVTNMAITDEQYNAFKWDEPITNADLACEVLNEYVVRCEHSLQYAKEHNMGFGCNIRKCANGKWPKAYFRNNILMFGDENGFAIYYNGQSAINMMKEWNALQCGEVVFRGQKRGEAKMNYEQGLINNYDWDAPITDPGLAKDVFNDCIRKQLEPKKAKMKIARCARCGEYPVADIAINTFVLGCSKCKRVFWARKCDSLTAMVEDWHGEQQTIIAATANNLRQNEEPTEGQEHKETEMATTGEMIEKYDWNEPIANNRVLAADALEACIERNFPEKSQFDGAYMYGFPAKMEILRHKNSGEIPKVIKAEDGFNIGIGVDGFCYVWANPSDTLATLVDKWNKVQGKPTKETTEEPQKETSLDIMGRNALALPQQTKTIEELEAEADRGLAKPEDVQKLKEANVLTGSQKAIAEVCDEIKELLLEKNRKYGNSALNPCRIFARSDRLEQIRVRIDDKLNRIKNEQSDEDEDVVKDLIGYLVLYTVAQLHDFNN